MMTYTNRNGIVERIVYIEYFRGVPHDVITTDAASLRGISTYDIDPYGGDVSDLMYYKSGGGPNSWEIETYAIEGTNCQLWIDPEFRERMALTLRNTELIAEPIMLTDLHIQSTNPFEVGHEVGDITYCEKCELHYDEDYCPIHDCEFTEDAEEEWASRNNP
jgi:hypothetical protein